MRLPWREIYRAGLVYAHSLWCRQPVVPHAGFSPPSINTVRTQRVPEEQKLGSYLPVGLEWEQAASPAS